MWFCRTIGCALAALAVASSPATLAWGADAPVADASKQDAAKPDASKLPHLAVDVKKKQVRVECEAVNAQMPLEFFVCMSGTAEHEAVLRSPVKPSHLHLALLMLGLQPGEPVRFSKAADKWLPPSGPPLHLSVEWEGKDKKTVRYPANRLMRNVKTKKEMPSTTWIFAGSRIMEDGKYAADTTGYIVSVVNFDLTMIDIPELASNANETLEWECNPELLPEKGTKVYLVIEPVGKDDAQKPAGPKADATTGAVALTSAPATTDKPADKDAPLSDVQVDELKVKKLRERWEQVVKPRADPLKQAAQAHYEVVNALRREQNRLIDEADRVQRVIDQLQREYQEMTTPRPEGDDAREPAAP